MQKLYLSAVMFTCLFLLAEAGCAGIVHLEGPAGGSITSVRGHGGRGAAVIKTPGNSGVVLVKSKPPKPKKEHKGKSPSKNHVWIPGHWQHSNGSWHWKRGYWAKKPRVNAVYIPVRWVLQGDGWRIEGGYWQ